MNRSQPKAAIFLHQWEASIVKLAVHDKCRDKCRAVFCAVKIGVSVVSSERGCASWMITRALALSAQAHPQTANVFVQMSRSLRMMHYARLIE